MQPLILSLDPSLSTHFSTLTPQALADALTDVLPQALDLLSTDTRSSAIVPSHNMHGLHPALVLTLQLSTLDSFLGVADAAND